MSEPDDYFAMAARAERAEGQAQVLDASNRVLRRSLIGAAVFAAAAVAASIAGFAQASGARPVVAVIDPGTRTVHWIEPDIAQAWPLFRSNEEAFALNAVQCMDSFSRATWRWNWEKCREMADAKAWDAGLEYRFGEPSRETPDVLAAMYPGDYDMAEVKFSAFPVKLWEANGGRFARVEFTRIDRVGGQKRSTPMVAELTYYLPERVPDQPSAMGRAVNPAQLRFLTYRSEAQR